MLRGYVGTSAAALRHGLTAAMLATTPMAGGVSPQDGWNPGPGARHEFDAGTWAIERQDWRGAVAAFEEIVARRSWDEDAHTLLAYALRKLGKPRLALAHYAIALKLNPLHVQALEYLGEAHLALDDQARARATSARLAAACLQLEGKAGDATEAPDCPEWRALRSAIEWYTAQAGTVEILKGAE